MADEREMTLLKKLLMSRHLETHRAFRLEYDKVARKLDKRLIASAPGREQYGRWLAGRVKTKPSADHCRVLEHMFPGRTVAELLAPYDPEKGTSDIPETPSDAQEEAATNRRKVFQLGAATMAAGLIDTVTRGPDQLDQILDISTVGDGRLRQLEAEADALGLRFIYSPPTSLLPETLTHISSVRELLKSRQPLDAQRRLTRVGAKLSMVMAEILFATNRPTLARRWWSTAQRAADEAGDRQLSDIALAQSTYLPTYIGTPNEVLDQVTPRLEQATKATPPIAMLWGFAAMAHATLGKRDEFERAIHRSRNVLTRCDPDAVKLGIFSYLPRKHAFFEARGRADLGDAEGAGDAAVQALGAYEDTAKTDPAVVRFAYASALLKSGELEEACRLGAKAIATMLDLNMKPTYPVMIRAYDFDAVIDRKAAGALVWHETLARAKNVENSTTTST